MSINAIVSAIYRKEDGSGKLHLKKYNDDPAGQPQLKFDSSPKDLHALYGRHVWGGDSNLLIGETVIANRIGYQEIEFTLESLSGVEGGVVFGR